MATPDPSDPQVWWRLLVDAVACLQTGGTFEANEYLLFTKKHRGAAAARAAKENLKRLAAAQSWQTCPHWRSWGYKTTPPVRANTPKGKRR